VALCAHDVNPAFFGQARPVGDWGEPAVNPSMLSVFRRSMTVRCRAAVANNLIDGGGRFYQLRGSMVLRPNRLCAQTALNMAMMRAGVAARLAVGVTCNASNLRALWSFRGTGSARMGVVELISFHMRVVKALSIS
jgi:hypothetical protein